MPSPTDERVAFFAVSEDGKRSLRILEGDQILDLTYADQDSGLGGSFQIHLDVPPAWSPDGRWIAFLAEQIDGKGNAVELFVARTDERHIQRLSNAGNVVKAMAWVKTGTQAYALMYIERQGDGAYALKRVSFAPMPSKPELLALFPAHPR